MMSTNSPTVDYEEDLIKESSRPKSLVEIVAYFFSGSFIVLITIVFMNFLLAMSIRDVQVSKSGKIPSVLYFSGYCSYPRCLIISLGFFDFRN
jgi:hypothetical protein